MLVVVEEFTFCVYLVLRQRRQFSILKTRENWLHTNAEEIMAFLGVVVFMGIVKLPKVSMYFNADPRIYQVAVASVFSRNRFFQLLKYLHVFSPTEVPAREHPDYKLYRIKPLTDTLS